MFWGVHRAKRVLGLKTSQWRNNDKKRSLYRDYHYYYFLLKPKFPLESAITQARLLLEKVDLSELIPGGCTQNRLGCLPTPHFRQGAERAGYGIFGKKLGRRRMREGFGEECSVRTRHDYQLPHWSRYKGRRKYDR